MPYCFLLLFPSLIYWHHGLIHLDDLNDEIAWHCCEVSVVVTACIRSGCVVEDVVVRVVAFLLLLLLQEGLVLLVHQNQKVGLPSIPNHHVDVLAAAVAVDTGRILVQRYIAVVFAFQKVRLLLLLVVFLFVGYVHRVDSTKKADLCHLDANAQCEKGSKRC